MDIDLEEAIKKLNVDNEKQKEQAIRIISNLHLSGFELTNELLDIISKVIKGSIDSKEELSILKKRVDK